MRSIVFLILSVPKKTTSILVLQFLSTNFHGILIRQTLNCVNKVLKNGQTKWKHPMKIDAFHGRNKNWVYLTVSAKRFVLCHKSREKRRTQKSQWNMLNNNFHSFFTFFCTSFFPWMRWAHDTIFLCFYISPKVFVCCI